MDPGAFRKMALGRWGIEERDPTNDRELVDFCFSLPPAALLKDGIDRPALRVALSGRVAEQVLATGLRGYQSADWHRLVDPNRVRAFIDSRTSGSNVIDVAALRNAVEQWPDSGWEDRSIIYRFAIDLMRTLAALEFAQIAANRKFAGQ